MDGGPEGGAGGSVRREDADGTSGRISTRDPRPLGFPGDMSEDRRRSYRAVLLYFLGIVAALMWPVYEAAAGIEPRVLGIPFSLAYLVILLLGSFFVLLGLYLWEGRRYGHGDGEPDG